MGWGKKWGGHLRGYCSDRRVKWQWLSRGSSRGDWSRDTFWRESVVVRRGSDAAVTRDPQTAAYNASCPASQLWLGSLGHGAGSRLAEWLLSGTSWATTAEGERCGGGVCGVKSHICIIYDMSYVYHICWLLEHPLEMMPINSAHIYLVKTSHMASP